MARNIERQQRIAAASTAALLIAGTVVFGELHKAASPPSNHAAIETPQTSTNSPAAVKLKYNLWVTQSEHNAIQTILASCPDQTLPTTSQ